MQDKPCMYTFFKGLSCNIIIDYIYHILRQINRLSVNCLMVTCRHIRKIFFVWINVAECSKCA